MRLQVVGEDVYEVKRTHITNKLRDIGTSFCDFIKSLCESNKTTFVWDEKYLDYACVTFKSVDEDDLFEILILTEKKEEALDIVKKCLIMVVIVLLIIIQLLFQLKTGISI